RAPSTRTCLPSAPSRPSAWRRCSGAPLARRLRRVGRRGSIGRGWSSLCRATCLVAAIGRIHRDHSPLERSMCSSRQDSGATIRNTLIIGITSPVLPHLITNCVGDKAATAAIYGLLVTIWGLMQFLFSPLIGVLSDRFGRRPVLILSGFGLGLDYIIMALAQSLPWFFVGRILSGIMSSSFATAAAYVADVTPVER